MASGERRWRVVCAAAGVVAYRPVVHVLQLTADWRQPILVLYDVPVLLLAFSFAGGLLHALINHESRVAAMRAAALAPALVFAWGAGLRHWPISGHLTVALAVGIVEAGDRTNPRWLRALALLPAALLIGIRTFRPQTTLMSNGLYTAVACAAGVLIAGLAVSVASAIRRLARPIGSGDKRR